LNELSLMTFENDVKFMAAEGSDELLKLLRDPLLKVHLQNFALSIQKADLVRAWPVLCKYGQLVEASVNEREEEAEDDEPKKKKKEDLAGLQVIEDLLAGKNSSSANADDDSVSKERNVEEGAAESNSLVVVSASKKNLYGNVSSSGLHKISGQHLMLFLVFLMVIYRGLNMLFQQRKVRSLVSRSSLDNLLTDKH